METQTQEEVYNALIEDGFEPDEADRLVAEYVDDPAMVDHPRFEVTDASSANWVLKKLAETQKQIDEISRLASDETGAILNRAAQITKPLTQRRQFFELAFGKQLEEWAAAELEGQKVRSRPLIHGTVGFRKSPDKLVVDDEEALVAWAYDLGYDDLLKTSLLVAPVKKRLQDDCDVPFAHLEGGEDKFYIKAAMPDAAK